MGVIPIKDDNNNDTNKPIDWTKEPFTLTVSSETEVDFSQLRLGVVPSNGGKPNKKDIPNEIIIFRDPIDVKDKEQHVSEGHTLFDHKINIVHQIVESEPKKNFKIKIQFTHVNDKKTSNSIDMDHDYGIVIGGFFTFYLVDANDEYKELTTISAIGNSFGDCINIKGIPNTIIEGKTYTVENIKEIKSYSNYYRPVLFDSHGREINNGDLFKRDDQSFVFGDLNRGENYYFFYETTNYHDSNYPFNISCPLKISIAPKKETPDLSKTTGKTDVATTIIESIEPKDESGTEDGKQKKEDPSK